MTVSASAIIWFHKIFQTPGLILGFYFYFHIDSSISDLSTKCQWNMYIHSSNSMVSSETSDRPADISNVVFIFQGLVPIYTIRPKSVFQMKSSSISFADNIHFSWRILLKFSTEHDSVTVVVRRIRRPRKNKLTNEIFSRFQFQMDFSPIVLIVTGSRSWCSDWCCVNRSIGGREKTKGLLWWRNLWSYRP